MRHLTRAAPLLFFVALLPAQALAQSAPICVPTAGNGGILTGLATQFSTSTAPWTNTALGYAQGLFFALVAIEIAWSAITYVLQKDSLPDFVASLLLKLIGVGFFYTVLQPQYGPVWIADIIASFSQAGSVIGGHGQAGPSDPSSIFNCGTDIASAMLQSISQGRPLNFGTILPGIEAMFAALICSLGVVIAFAIVAGQLLITLIESYIVVGAGVFMLGFTGSRWTMVFGEKYIGYAVSVGIKLFMLELIVGLGYGLGQQWAALFATGIAPPETYIEVVGAALIFGFLSWHVPSLAGSLMNGAPSMTLGNFLNTAGAVAVGSAITGVSVLSSARSLSVVTSSANMNTSAESPPTGDGSKPYSPLVSDTFAQYDRESPHGTPSGTSDAQTYDWSDLDDPRTSTDRGSTASPADDDTSDQPRATDRDGASDTGDVIDKGATAQMHTDDVTAADEAMRAAQRADARDTGRTAGPFRPTPAPDDAIEERGISIRFDPPDSQTE